MSIDPQVITYLQILGIDLSKATNGLSPSLIKKAYRKKVREVHPDHGGNEEAFKLVVHAYRMLTDPDYQQKQKIRKQPICNLDLDLTVGCTFEDAFFGRTVLVTLNRPKLDSDGNVIDAKDEAGAIQVTPETFVVQMPAGSTEGHIETLPNKGVQCGNWSGTLRIRIVPQKHPTLTIRSRPMPFGHIKDVYSILPIPLATMIRGGETEVVTMYGIKTIWIPPGSPPSAQIRIKKCGVGQVGDHIALIQPVFPIQQELKSPEWEVMKIRWDEQKQHEQKIAQEETEESKDFLRFGFFYVNR